MAEENKPTVTIDGKEYDATTLSDQAKAIVRNIQFADQEIMRQQMGLNALQTARQAYVGALKKELEGGSNDGASTTE
jgi:hypothetical protein